MITPDAKRVTFKDVAGLQEEKEELEEIVDFLKDPQKFIQVGARIPREFFWSALRERGKPCWPRPSPVKPGVPFFSISGSDFVEMFVGVGASRVRDLFEEAKKHQPCIVLLTRLTRWPEEEAPAWEAAMMSGSRR